jgi:hypothetical protein
MPHCAQGDCKGGCFGWSCSCQCDMCLAVWREAFETTAAGPKPAIIRRCGPADHNWSEWNEEKVNWRSLQVFPVMIRMCWNCYQPEFKPVGAA